VRYSLLNQRGRLDMSSRDLSLWFVPVRGSPTQLSPVKLGVYRLIGLGSMPMRRVRCLGYHEHPPCDASFTP
jgi:hypothetical protein